MSRRLSFEEVASAVLGRNREYEEAEERRERAARPVPSLPRVTFLERRSLIGGMRPRRRPPRALVDPGTCAMESSFKEKVRARWPAALWVFGDGPYACVSACPPGVTVILCASLEGAEKRNSNIDRFECGGQCRAKHDVVTLP
jgi:hypothetical protein